MKSGHKQAPIRTECAVGAKLWSITEELGATQLATLQQLDPHKKYEIKVSAKSSQSDEIITSATQLIRFGPEPGNFTISSLHASHAGEAEYCF